MDFQIGGRLIRLKIGSIDAIVRTESRIEGNRFLIICMHMSHRPPTASSKNPVAILS